METQAQGPSLSIWPSGLFRHHTHSLAIPLTGPAPNPTPHQTQEKLGFIPQETRGICHWVLTFGSAPCAQESLLLGILQIPDLYF